MELQEILDRFKPQEPVAAIDVPNLPRGVVVIHENYRLQDTETLEEKPHAIRAAVSLVGIDSFVNYVNKFKDEDSLLFVTPDVTSIARGQALATAVLDYHRVGDPRWSRHVVTLSAGPGKVYEKLIALDGNLYDQSQFAKYIEELAKFSLSLPATNLLEICRTLKLSQKGEFKSAEDDVSGSVDFVFNVAVSASAGSTDNRLSVPAEIVFRAAPIEGMTDVEVAVKLVYRIPEQVGGKVQLGIKIIDRTWLEKAAIEMAAEKLTKDTALLTLTGKSTPITK